MNNTEYYEKLQLQIAKLEALKSQGIPVAQGIIGQTLCEDDLFFCASLNRCINLIAGFEHMLEERNLTCAGALLRILLDTCMRTYAAYIADDQMSVIRCVIDGNRIDKLKDKKGNFLKDFYLKEELNKIDNQFTQVYEQACGFVHLSSKAFFQTVEKCEDNGFGFYIGTDLPEKFNPILLECVNEFVHYMKLFYWLLDPVVESKKRFDETQQ